MNTENQNCFLCKATIEQQSHLLTLKEYQLAIRGGYQIKKSNLNLKQPDNKNVKIILSSKQDKKNELKEIFQMEKELSKNGVQICTTCRKKIDTHINHIA